MAEMLVCDSFDAMNMKEELVKGIKEYGYSKPSTIQQCGIMPLSKSHDVILQATYVTKTAIGNLQEKFELENIATYCSTILERLDFSVEECQCLVITPFSTYADKIVACMRALGQHLPVKVKVEHCVKILQLLLM